MLTRAAALGHLQGSQGYRGPGARGQGARGQGPGGQGACGLCSDGVSMWRGARGAEGRGAGRAGAKGRLQVRGAEEILPVTKCVSGIS